MPMFNHTHMTSNGNTTGSKAVYRCIPGYTSVLPVYVLVCTDTGTWKALTEETILCQCM